MSIDSVSQLVDAVREYSVLGPTHLDEAGRLPRSQFPDALSLARELMQRGWLTAFQANRLLQGRGAELVLGPYLVLEPLGAGGMGEVFKARHQLMDRLVAIKVIRKERLAHPNAVLRFQREIRLAAQLDHPHLIRAHDAAQVGDLHFLVMEYAEGIDLQRLVRKSGPLPVGQACAYARQAALGLQHTAERGLVHRDIKPSNLQLTAGGTMVKILDLGLARSQAAEEEPGVAALTQLQTILGTADYMAPEQTADPRGVDIRADLYSLGCTLYFLLAGRPPFPEGSWEEKLACHRQAQAQPIEQLRPGVPPALGSILRRMMAKCPGDRHSTPAAVADALAPFCSAIGPQPPTELFREAPSSVANPLPSSMDGTAGQERGWTLEVASDLSPVLPPPNPEPQPPPVGPERGWTLEMSSSLPSAPPPTNPEPRPPVANSPVPVASPALMARLPAPSPSAKTARSDFPGQRRRWFAVAGCFGILGLLVLLLILLWPIIGVLLMGREQIFSQSGQSSVVPLQKEVHGQNPVDDPRPDQPFDLATLQKGTLVQIHIDGSGTTETDQIFDEPGGVKLFNTRLRDRQTVTFLTRGRNGQVKIAWSEGDHKREGWIDEDYVRRLSR